MCCARRAILHTCPGTAPPDPIGGLPYCQAPKKAAAPLSSQPQLALEVPLGSGRGAGSGLPRLPFDAGAAVGGAGRGGGATQWDQAACWCLLVPIGCNAPCTALQSCL